MIEVFPRLLLKSSHFFLGNYPYWSTKYFVQCVRGFKVHDLSRSVCTFLAHPSAIVSLFLQGPDVILCLPDIFNNLMSEPIKKNG